LAQIQAEFGGANPIYLSEYYRGGAYVPNTTPNLAIPTSGAIDLADFYGTTNTVSQSYTLTCGTFSTTGKFASTINGYRTAPFSPTIGAISPTTFNGYTILSLTDGFGVVTARGIAFAGNLVGVPVFTSLVAGGVTVYAASASTPAGTYNAAGYTSWDWLNTSVGIPASGSIAATISL
jgi:hypothetical protein